MGNAVLDASDARPYTGATYMVQLGRQFQIHGVLKRAFYELVSSPAFWEDSLFEARTDPAERGERAEASGDASRIGEDVA